MADLPGVEDFVYDGQGKRLVLPQDISVDEPLPLILLGPGKTLQLKNLTLVHAASLPACLQLGAGEHYSLDTLTQFVNSPTSGFVPVATDSMGPYPCCCHQTQAAMLMMVYLVVSQVHSL